MTNATRYVIRMPTTSSRAWKSTIPRSTRARTAASPTKMIFDSRPLKQVSGIDKLRRRQAADGLRLPLHAVLVPGGGHAIEPTESEPMAELSRREPQPDSPGYLYVIDGKVPRSPGTMSWKNAPHTAAAGSQTEWPHAYTRQQAAYPLPLSRARASSGHSGVSTPLR